MAFTLEPYLRERRVLVETALAAELDALLAAGTPPALVEAMRYALLAGGKRLRPILVMAACEAVGGRAADAVPAGCAIEMIHTYSLVHDDLPAMDDDDFRRGQPTCHKKFGEATAILAGDALLTEAFGVAARSAAGPAVVVELMKELARAAGAAGMVGGQMLDIAATGRKGVTATLDEIEHLHGRKTGDLLRGAVRMGARIGGADADALGRLDAYGRALGLAFQIVDDVLDVTADLSTLGKDPGSDREAGKTTFVDLLGVDGARARARAVMDGGLAALAAFGERAAPLAALGRYTIERDR